LELLYKLSRSFWFRFFQHEQLVLVRFTLFFIFTWLQKILFFFLVFFKIKVRLSNSIVFDLI
jgi:hypothetical protein